MHQTSFLQGSIKFAGLIIVLGMSISAGFANDSQELSNLENRFFHHDFTGQDINLRVARLEKNVFGEELGGELNDRVSRLAEATSAQPAPASSATTESKDVVVNDEDCAIQRAQVAIKAAGEQETSKLLAEAVKQFRDGKLIESREIFEQVVKVDPNNCDANFSLGIIDEGSGNLAEALSSYKKALGSRPDKTEYREAVIALVEKMKKYAGLDSRRVQIRSLSSAALRAYSHGEYQTALNLYLALDEKSPNQAIVKSNLATVYIALKQPNKAVDYYKQAMQINPYDDRFKQGLAHAEKLVGETETQSASSLEDKLEAMEQPEGDSSFQNLGLRASSASTVAKQSNY